MSQSPLTDRSYVNSNLFSGHYLNERIQAREEWACDERARVAMSELQSLYEREGNAVETYDEDELIKQWIDKVLATIGFSSSVEVTLPDSTGFVDELLFENDENRLEAADVYSDTKDTADIFKRGISIIEAKQWDADFSRRFNEQRPYRNASHQIKHYLERSPENIQWGILTNGRKWRLYGTKDYETQTYYEVDLPELLESDDLESFKYFYVLFNPGAFRKTAGTTFLDSVWSESETAAQELGEDLQNNVFTALRVLGRGFVETNDLDVNPDDDEALEELKEQSLVLLYRLMFVLYAEARGLIHPDDKSAKDEYESNFSLNELRLEIHDTLGEVDKGFETEYSEHSTAMWSRLSDLFRLIDQGEQSLGIPPYNGGLFDHDKHAFLTHQQVSNRYLAEVIYRLSTTENGDGRYVLADYADLDTRHLGSVYEGLLEHQFRIAPEQYAAVAKDGSQVWKPASEVTVADAVETVSKGELYVVNDEGERKATGAYYTPDYVVTYIVEETVGPLIDEIEEEAQSEGLAPGTEEYVYALSDRVLNLRVLDPAMGSGHFLTRATGYIAERVMARIREVDSEVGTLYDEQDFRRKVAKECIYGVDVNSMAVELAKLSMWLETLAADKPLAFFDHHLKAGNSLIGSDVTEVLSNGNGNGNDGQLTLREVFAQVREDTLEHVMNLMEDLLAIDNETLADVRSMEEKYDEIRGDPLYLRLFELTNVHTAEKFGLDIPDDVFERMADAIEDEDEWARIQAQSWFVHSQTVASDETFFHWELEFPEVFFGEDGKIRKNGGFDVVIGNPPYVSNWKLTEKNKQLVEVIDALYTEAASGHWDLFIPFGYRATRLTRDGGFHSFITPNAIATEKYGSSLRAYFIKNCHIEKLISFDEFQVFNEVDRQYLVYIVSPGRKSGDCEIVHYDGTDFIPGVSVDQKSFLNYSHNSFRIDVNSDDIMIKERIEKQSIPLGRVCFVNPGVVAHSASDSPLNFSKDDVIDTKPGKGKKKYISGGDMGANLVKWDGEFIDYGSYREHFHRPKFPEQFESPKIMFSHISGEMNRIKSCYDDDGYYTNHSIIHAVQWSPKIEALASSMNYDSISNAADYDLRYVAALANSNLINYYFSLFLATGTLQGSYSRMQPENIRQLPIYEIVFEGPKEERDKIRTEIRNILMAGGPKSLSEHLNTELSNGVSHERIHECLSCLNHYVIDTNKKYDDLNEHLLDHFGSYSKGCTLPEIGFVQPPVGSADSILNETAEQKPNLKIGDVEIIRESPTSVEIRLTARYKPEDEEEFETDRWGYTETSPLPALIISELAEDEADLIEAFVPVAVDKANGFADFRKNATKRNSLIDRLRKLTIPAIDDVREGLRSYQETTERADELDKKIKRTDQLINEIVYELYGLTDEEIVIVEGKVGKQS